MVFLPGYYYAGYRNSGLAKTIYGNNSYFSRSLKNLYQIDDHCSVPCLQRVKVHT